MEKSAMNIPDPLALLTEGENGEIVSYVEDQRQKIYLTWSNGNAAKRAALLKIQSAAMHETYQFLRRNIKEYALFSLGTLWGTIESFEFLSYSSRQEKWAEARLLKESGSVRHLEEIVRELESHGPMYHGELCKRLGMNAPTLTEAMKKVTETGFVRAETFGKYKLYSLTDDGIRYGQMRRRANSHKVDLEEILQNIDQLLRNTKDASEQKRIRNAVQEAAADAPAGQPKTAKNEWRFWDKAGYMLFFGENSYFMKPEEYRGICIQDVKPDVDKGDRRRNGLSDEPNIEERSVDLPNRRYDGIIANANASAY